MRLGWAVVIILFPVEIQARGRWPGVAAKTVRVYLYNLAAKPGDSSPVRGNTLNQSVVQPGVALESAETKELAALFSSDTRLLEMGLSNCYVPHHAFVYFDAADRPLAWASVCFGCDGIQLYQPRKRSQWPAGKEAQPKEIAQAQALLHRLKQLVVATKLPVLERLEDYTKLQGVAHEEANKTVGPQK